MARLRPFRALRFTTAAGELSDILAPPWYEIGTDQRTQLERQSDYNVVELIRPLRARDDRSKFVQYARSMERLTSWRREAILAVDEKPAFYRIHVQTGGNSVSYLLGVLEVHADSVEFGETARDRVEDRLRLLEATQVQLEPAICRLAASDFAGSVPQEGETLPAASLADGTFAALEILPSSNVVSIRTETDAILIDGSSGWAPALHQFRKAQRDAEILASPNDVYLVAVPDRHNEREATQALPSGLVMALLKELT